MIRQCYKHGYSKEDTHLVMNFFDWVIRLPESYKNRLKKIIRKIEEEFKMEYIPLWERDARKEGEKKGKIETAKNLLKMGIDIDRISNATGLKKIEREQLASKSH